MPKVLKKGHSRDEVTELQNLLLQRGYPVDVDCDFNLQTYHAVRAFQSHNLDQHGQPLVTGGVVGPLTWRNLTHPKPNIKTPTGVDYHHMPPRNADLGNRERVAQSVRRKPKEFTSPVKATWSWAKGLKPTAFARMTAVLLAATSCSLMGLAQDTYQALHRVSAYFEHQLKAPYMAQNCEATSYPNWDGFPLQKCRYSVTDKDGTKKSATVILLIPTAERLARWVVYACMEVKGSPDARCTNKLSKQIIRQSGGQFPVAGIVMEDLLPDKKPDGIYEIYPFRDGVTVSVHGIRNQSTSQPTDEQINEALVGPVKGSGKYARVQGTTREEYKANGGTVDVGDSSPGHRKLSWLEVSRNLFKSAWDKDRNELLIAWARADLK